MTVTGIDIAGYQSATYSTKGLSFVLVKATEGTGYVNPKMTAQAAHGRAADAVIGFYHFLHPGSVKEQAAYFVAECASQAGDILACDWEPTSSGLASAADKDAFIREVKRLRPDHRVILYCDVSRWTGVDKTSYCGDGLWIADPNHPAGHPGIKAVWLFDQYSSAGGVDHDVSSFATKAALLAWAKGGTPTSPAEDDDMPTTKEFVEELLDTDAIPASRVLPNADAKTNVTWTVRYTLQTAVESARAAQKAAEACVAQLASIGSVLTAIQKDGGLTAEQAVAAGKAGADAALAELGDRLSPPAPADA